MIEELIMKITQTETGYPVRCLKWNKLDNIIVGQVKDPILGDERRLDGYVVCQWRRNGIPTNKFKGRDDLKLKMNYE